MSTTAEATSELTNGRKDDDTPKVENLPPNSDHTLIESGEIMRLIDETHCIAMKAGETSVSFKYAIMIDCSKLDDPKYEIPSVVVESYLYKNGQSISLLADMNHTMETREGTIETFENEGSMISKSDYDHMCIEVVPGEYEQACAVLINLELTIDELSILEGDEFHLVTFIPDVGAHEISRNFSDFHSLNNNKLDHISSHIQITELPFEGSKFCGTTESQEVTLIPEEGKDSTKQDTAKKATSSESTQTSAPYYKIEHTSVKSYEIKNTMEMQDSPLPDFTCLEITPTQNEPYALLVEFNLVVEDNSYTAEDSFTLVSILSPKEKDYRQALLEDVKASHKRNQGKTKYNPIRFAKLQVNNSFYCHTADNALCYEAVDGEISIPMRYVIFVDQSQLRQQTLPDLGIYVFKNEHMINSDGKSIRLTSAIDEGAISTASKDDGNYFCIQAEINAGLNPILVNINFD